jgi:2'-5' RNA ligase
MRLRAFIAVDISNTDAIEKLQQELVADTRWPSGHFTPVRRQNLHFTLIFLGTIGFETVDKVKMILSDIEFETINLTFRGVGGFPGPEFSRVIWVGVDESGKSALVSLAAQIVLKLSRINIAPDRPFRPHLTIFRARSKLELGSEVISKYYDKTIGTDTIDRVHFKQSELTSFGPRYSNIFTVHAK